MKPAQQKKIKASEYLLHPLEPWCASACVLDSTIHNKQHSHRSLLSIIEKRVMALQVVKWERYRSSAQKLI